MTDTRYVELRNYFVTSTELQRAMREGNPDVGFLLDELRTIIQHSEWPALRERCAVTYFEATERLAQPFRAATA